MTEPNNRELNEKIGEIREWLVRIDTKVDFLNEVKSTAERAEQKADKALQKADEQTKQLDGIKKTAQWAIGLMVPAIIALAGIVVSVAF